jgi:hypothetical protein
VNRTAPTVAYLEGRERVLGGRLVLHRDTEIAVELLCPALGGRALAYQWLLAVIDALEKHAA